MSEQEIIENNKLIAEFMGWTVEKNHFSKVEKYGDKLQNERGISVKNRDYHSDWNLLMPVVEKIEINCKFDVHIYGHYNWKEPNRCVILDWRNKEIVGTFNDSKIQCVFDAVVEFIKWYNQNK